MAKTSKAQTKTATKQKTVKPHVVSFRMTEAQYVRLVGTCDQTQVLGASSPRQFARKIICDFLSGKLYYKNPKDLKLDLEAYSG